MVCLENWENNYAISVFPTYNTAVICCMGRIIFFITFKNMLEVVSFLYPNYEIYCT